MGPVTHDLTPYAYFAGSFPLDELTHRNDLSYRLSGTNTWYTAYYQDGAALSRDPRFSSARVARRFPPGWLNFSDPPQRKRLRLLRPALSSDWATDHTCALAAPWPGSRQRSRAA
jgi:hypothetical protein